jgi:hypothetical protein
LIVFPQSKEIGAISGSGMQYSAHAGFEFPHDLVLATPSVIKYDKLHGPIQVSIASSL